VVIDFPGTFGSLAQAIGCCSARGRAAAGLSAEDICTTGRNRRTVDIQTGHEHGESDDCETGDREAPPLFGE
jgi:hypothetical protein